MMEQTNQQPVQNETEGKPQTKLPTATLLVSLTFLITLGLAIGLQSVFGIGIGSNLDFGGIRRIIGLPVPLAGSEAANRDYVDSAIGGVGGIPAGAVMSFNLASCPSGWSEFTAAQGRYVVGLPAGGTLGGTDGTALTNLEDRPAGPHTHPVSDPGHKHDAGIYNNNCALPFRTVRDTTSNIGGQSCGWTSFNVTGITVGSGGVGSGTNAPYVQLLVCQKN